MSAKNIRSTVDLVRFRASVRIDCRNCGAARTLDGPTFLTTLGRCGLERAAERLRCTRCGAKGARMTVLPPV